MDTALPWVRSNTPATREVDWMNSCRHNKNATDIPAFIREKNMFSPSLRSFEYLVRITTEASKLKTLYSDQPYSLVSDAALLL